MPQPTVLSGRRARTLALVVSLPLLVGSEPAARTQPSPPALTVAIVVDDLHLNFTSTGRVRAAVRALLPPLARDGWLASLTTTGPSHVRLDARADSARIDAAVKQLSGNGLHADNLTMPIGRPPWREPRDRAEAATAIIDAAITAAAATSADRRMAVLLSLGYRTDDAGIDVVVARLVQRAITERVAIVPVAPEWFDPGGGTQGQLSDAAWRHHRASIRASLERLASETGGTIWARDEPVEVVVARLF